MTAVLSLPQTALPVDALNPDQLRELTRFYAAEVSAGTYPYVRYDERERWHLRLHRDQRVDVWLISWLPTQGTQLHDHGGSSGAFTVVSGTLSEAVYIPRGQRAGSLRERTLRAERGRALPRDDMASVGFGAEYVHDVRNTSTSPAVSVHAYSSPLTSVTFYELEHGRLVRLASLATDDPEPEFVR